MKIGYLLIGRLKSTRLPNKLLLDIKGKPVISHLLDRLKLTKKVDEMVVRDDLAKSSAKLCLQIYFFHKSIHLG